MEKHSTGDEVLHIELPNQVSFFNRASLDNTLRAVPRGGHVLLDATTTDYIDPDILDLILDFQNARNKQRLLISLVGFKDKYAQLEDHILYADLSTKETQSKLTPDRVIEILQEGNLRFRKGTHLTRDIGIQR